MIDEKKLLEKAEKDIRVGRYSLLAFMEIVNQLAEEYKVSEMTTGWITDRVPTKEECGNYGKEFLATIPQGGEYKTIAMRYEYTTVRGKEVSRWMKYGRIAPWEPIAWQPLPAPYMPKGE